MVMVDDEGGGTDGELSVAGNTLTQTCFTRVVRRLYLRYNPGEEYKRSMAILVVLLQWQNE